MEVEEAGQAVEDAQLKARPPCADDEVLTEPPEAAGGGSVTGACNTGGGVGCGLSPMARGAHGRGGDNGSGAPAPLTSQQVCTAVRSLLQARQWTACSRNCTTSCFTRA